MSSLDSSTISRVGSLLLLSLLSNDSLANIGDRLARVVRLITNNRSLTNIFNGRSPSHVEADGCTTSWSLQWFNAIDNMALFQINASKIYRLQLVNINVKLKTILDISIKSFGPISSASLKHWNQKKSSKHLSVLCTAAGFAWDTNTRSEVAQPTCRNATLGQRKEWC